MSSSVHIDNKNKDERKYKDEMILHYQQKLNILLILHNQGKRFVLSLHYDGSNSFLFVSATEIYQFKAKDSGIKDYTLCLGSMLQDFTINYMKKKQD